MRIDGTLVERSEWQFLELQPPVDHLHEAFHCILLKWTVDPNTSGTPSVQSAKKRLLEDPSQITRWALRNPTYRVSSLLARTTCGAVQAAKADLMYS
jgi:hypothetical protein